MAAVVLAKILGDVSWPSSEVGDQELEVGDHELSESELSLSYNAFLENARHSINRLRDQSFEQGMIIYIEKC